jgi:hypothetical protein
MNIIQGINFNATLVRQENKCIVCKGTLNPERVFYWLDESHNEIYCETCAPVEDG